LNLFQKPVTAGGLDVFKQAQVFINTVHNFPFIQANQIPCLFIKISENDFTVFLK